MCGNQQPIRLAGFGTVLVCLAVSVCSILGEPDDPQPPPAARLRCPVAAAFVNDDRTVAVANQRSGSVMLVDVQPARVRAELAVGKHLTDLAVLPDHEHILIVDDERHELIALSCNEGRLRIRARLAVAAYPASVAVLADGERATVASLWSRRLQVVDVAPLSSPEKSPRLRIRHTIRLPFAPRCQCVLPRSSQVVVADAFGGQLAIVDVSAGRIVALHRLNGHNLRGLALSADGKRLFVSHGFLNEKTPVTEDNIRRGVLMANVVRVVPLDKLREPHADLDACRLLHLGEVGAGAGNPAAIAVLEDERLAVALAGVDEVALLDRGGKTTHRLRVGRRPVALAAAGAGQPIVVVNTFDDSLSLLDPRRGRVAAKIDLGPRAELTSQDRGERLFFDARLARDGWFSCHSCHSDGHTNGLLADTLGDDSYGTPKRTLTLRGTALTDPWAWNGGMKYLQDQIEKSLIDTMHAPSVSGQQINDLLSFLHTLPPPPPLEPISEDKADREKVERGRTLFRERGCVRCHIPPLTYSSHDVHDVGFADERGLRKFNPPSLRGVGQGYRFLHDNRAATLEEVFTKHRHKIGPGLTVEDRDDLLRFLRSL